MSGYEHSTTNGWNDVHGMRGWLMPDGAVQAKINEAIAFHGNNAEEDDIVTSAVFPQHRTVEWSYSKADVPADEPRVGVELFAEMEEMYAEQTESVDLRYVELANRLAQEAVQAT